MFSILHRDGGSCSSFSIAGSWSCKFSRRGFPSQVNKYPRGFSRTHSCVNTPLVWRVLPFCEVCHILCERVSETGFERNIFHPMGGQWQRSNLVSEQKGKRETHTEYGCRTAQSVCCSFMYLAVLRSHVRLCIYETCFRHSAAARVYTRPHSYATRQNEKQHSLSPVVCSGCSQKLPVHPVWHWQKMVFSYV